MIGDTIVALASAQGASERAVIRLSGPRAFEAAARVFAPALSRARGQQRGSVRLSVVARALTPAEESPAATDSPATGSPQTGSPASASSPVESPSAELEAIALTMPGPRSFTGEDIVELHVPGSPLLVRLLQEQLVRDGRAAGVREALPGEFTARACRNGRMDLAQVEGLLLLLHASDRREAAAAVQWLRGGLSDEVADVRRQLQDQLALLEVGLDFDEDDTGAVPTGQWRDPLLPLEQKLDQLVRSLPIASPGGELLLVGHANAGKSSLANALAGREQALVADVAGTTRDLLQIRVPLGPPAAAGATSADAAAREPGPTDGTGGAMRLWDAPGDLDDPGAADRSALALRERLAGRAAALLVVLDATNPRIPEFAYRSPLPWWGVVFSKCDLLPGAGEGGHPHGAALQHRLPAAACARLPSPSGRVFATSATTGDGLPALREAFLALGGGGGTNSGGVDAGAPLRSALQAAHAALTESLRAAKIAPELAAVELQAALRALDGIGGSHSPEQLLDRIYGRFCLGK
ncbi:MAG: GTPase [Planctomycetota bacterium]